MRVRYSYTLRLVVTRVYVVWQPNTPARSTRCGIMEVTSAFIHWSLSEESDSACQDKAREVGTSLSVAPSLEEYVGGAELDLGLAGQHQRVNAALAVSLAAAWEAKHAQVFQNH